MRFTVVTILPELIEPALAAGVVGRAREAGTITVDTVNPRDFTHDRHRTVDDTPYGGGPGMVMKAEPLLAAIRRASEPDGPGTIVEDVEDVATTLRFERPGRDSSEDLAATGRFERSAPVAQPEPSLARRVLTKVESTLAKLEAKLGRAGERSADARATGDAVDATIAEAEARIAQLEAQLGAPPRADAPAPDPARSVGAPAEPDRPDSRALGPAEAPRADDAQRGPAEPVQKQLGPRDDAEPPRDVAPRAGESAGDGELSEATGSTSSTSGVTANAAPGRHRRAHRILLSPSGRPLTQARVRQLAALDHLVLVCGRYEGIDQRVIDLAIDEEISIGDYVLSGGELGALVVIDAVSRLVPGVLGEPSSADDESFSAGLLEYPQYTRPPALDGQSVPPILQSGNHAAIATWRREQALRRTAARRPDLWRAFEPSAADRKLLPPLAARTHVALVHHPVVDRTGAVITTALTNFDIHDLARSAMAYGLAGYHVVTPITSQREKAEHIAKLWIEDAQGEHRAQALRLVRVAESIEAVIAALSAEHGRAPQVVATSARATSFPGVERRTSSELFAEASVDPAPLLILLGTGWGLADGMISSVSRVLAPIEGASDWNHLSVRSAGAVLLDRLLGRREW